MPFQPTQNPGVLHHFTSRLVAFEHHDSSGASTSQSTGATTHHTVLFLGGLGDGLMHPVYPSKLSALLPRNWTIAQVLLSSSYLGWTVSSLERDADEVARAVAYFRSLPGRSESEGARVVLLGHSTGAQACMEYFVGPWKEPQVPEKTTNRPKVDGIVLQGALSDREALKQAGKEGQGVELAVKWVKEGKGNEILPFEATDGILGANPSAKRWVSLAAAKGDDDYFSSDLDDATLKRTFGEVGRKKVPICVVMSGADEHMHASLDPVKIVQRWRQFVKSESGAWDEGSGVVEGATHNYNRSQDKIGALADKVVPFLKKVEEGGFTSSTSKTEKL